jgi:hypothetical protein
MKTFFGNSKKRISVHQFWALFSKNTVFKWKSLTILLTLYFSDSRHRQVEHWQRGGVLGHLSHERRWDVSRTRNSSISKKNLSLKSCCFQQCFNPLFLICPNDESTKSFLLSMTTLSLKHILVMVLVWCNLQSAKMVHWFTYPFNLEAFNITFLIQRLIIQFSCFCQIEILKSQKLRFCW